MKTKIYGASDDLIEIEGAINDELGCYYKKRTHITCSDGTQAVISYDGNWNIKVKETGILFDKIITSNPNEEPHTDIDAKECSAYSDVLVLKDGVEWIKLGNKTYKI